MGYFKRQSANCICGWAALVTFLLSSCGCGSPGPQPVAVSGTVTYNGEPVAAMITFIPAGNAGQVARGNSDQAGRFVLGTSAPGDGAYPGNYEVSIVPLEVPPMPGVDGMPASYKSPLPMKYGDPATSGFTAEVNEGGGNAFVFEMKD